MLVLWHVRLLGVTPARNITLCKHYVMKLYSQILTTQTIRIRRQSWGRQTDCTGGAETGRSIKWWSVHENGNSIKYQLYNQHWLILQWVISSLWSVSTGRGQFQIYWRYRHMQSVNRCLFNDFHWLIICCTGWVIRIYDGAVSQRFLQFSFMRVLGKWTQ